MAPETTTDGIAVSSGISPPSPYGPYRSRTANAVFMRRSSDSQLPLPRLSHSNSAQGPTLHESPTEWIEMQETPEEVERVQTATTTSSGTTTIRTGDSATTINMSAAAMQEDRASFADSIPRGSSFKDILVRFWKLHISVSVEMRDSRDHLALERTFLAYMRTSSVGAVTGTVISQLFVMDGDGDEAGFSYKSVGRPLATVCHSFAIVTICIGTYRVWLLQEAILNGKAIARGPQPMGIMICSLLFVLCIFGITLALDYAVQD